MAVITELHRSDIDHVLTKYDLGSLVSFRETHDGIENSNYIVCVKHNNSASDHKEYVLTVLEDQSLNNRSLVVATLERCFVHGLPVPEIVRTSEGAEIAKWRDREIVLCHRVLGNHVVLPTQKHCAAIGRFLARAHLILRSVDDNTPYARDLNWLKNVSQTCQESLQTEERRVLRRAMSLLGSLLERNDVQSLPQGIIHGDLFRDNVLFNQHGLCGVLDFHHAGYGYWLFDLAVAINDWCWENGQLDGKKTFTVLREYSNIRKLKAMEHWCFPFFLLYAAVGFWLSRLVISTRGDLPGDYPRKDPKEIEGKVLQHLMRPFHIHELVTSP